AERDLPAWLAAQPAALQNWLPRSGFKPEPGRWLTLPGDSGNRTVLVGTGDGALDPSRLIWLAAGLGDRLPAGDYALDREFGDARDELFAMGWSLGAYRFSRYRNTSADPALPRLRRPRVASAATLAALHAGTAQARDLINTPANDMGPAELEAAATALAAQLGGEVQVTTGAALREGYPLVAAVGQGSPREPRFIELRFRRAGAPKVALVGKGVCFDTGGLDIKAAAGMLLMKKDMGGAACALGVTRALRMLDVPVDLRVLIPAVENSVDGASFRPGDVWRSRKGLTVEVGNTDAEGRLVLADALHAASQELPDLVIDFATLTGAARIALGPELPPVYGGDAQLVAGLVQHAAAIADPLWPMPLWNGYEDELTSRIADLNNAPPSGLGGSITAALFLRRFVVDPTRWLHLDIYGWNPKDRPGRPAGAEAQGVRAVTTWLRQKYG
ncbi:MAG TPA: leucyl aminopeptidase family protein, partial [Steroidobacteraceae bacterium]|nr:leucyl aminopeptidase family protein [Steroidobacteraceae bacterium]